MGFDHKLDQIPVSVGEVREGVHPVLEVLRGDRRRLMATGRGLFCEISDGVPGGWLHRLPLAKHLLVFRRSGQHC